MRSGTPSPIACASASGGSPHLRKRLNTTCSPTRPFTRATGARSARRIRSSGSIARSGAAPMSRASSLMSVDRPPWRNSARAKRRVGRDATLHEPGNEGICNAPAVGQKAVPAVWQSELPRPLFSAKRSAGRENICRAYAAPSLDLGGAAYVFYAFVKAPRIFSVLVAFLGGGRPRQADGIDPLYDSPTRGESAFMPLRLILCCRISPIVTPLSNDVQKMCKRRVKDVQNVQWRCVDQSSILTESQLDSAWIAQRHTLLNIESVQNNW
jgi:hypothetical protein